MIILVVYLPTPSLSTIYIYIHIHISFNVKMFNMCWIWRKWSWHDLKDYVEFGWRVWVNPRKISIKIPELWADIWDEAFGTFGIIIRILSERRRCTVLCGCASLSGGFLVEWGAQTLRCPDEYKTRVHSEPQDRLRPFCSHHSHRWTRVQFLLVIQKFKLHCFLSFIVLFCLF